MGLKGRGGKRRTGAGGVVLGYVLGLLEGVCVVVFTGGVDLI